MALCSPAIVLWACLSLGCMRGMWAEYGPSSTGHGCRWGQVNTQHCCCSNDLPAFLFYTCHSAFYTEWLPWRPRRDWTQQSRELDGVWQGSRTLVWNMAMTLEKPGPCEVWFPNNLWARTWPSSSIFSLALGSEDVGGHKESKFVVSDETKIS